MSETIKQKLDEFHTCNEEARQHFSTHELNPGETMDTHTQMELLEYAKWRTKADIALNEYRTLLVKQFPGQLRWNLEELNTENNDLKRKLIQIEGWLSDKHS